MPDVSVQKMPWSDLPTNWAGVFQALTQEQCSIFSFHNCPYHFLSILSTVSWLPSGEFWFNLCFCLCIHGSPGITLREKCANRGNQKIESDVCLVQYPFEIWYVGLTAHMEMLRKVTLSYLPTREPGTLEKGSLQYRVKSRAGMGQGDQGTKWAYIASGNSCYL